MSELNGLNAPAASKGGSWGNLIKSLEKGLIMRILKISLILLLFAGIFLTTGCDELSDLKIRNETQRKRISELESHLQATELNIDQSSRVLQAANDRCNIETEALQQKNVALEEDIIKKKALIASIQQQLLYGTQLPAELSAMLEEFAEKEEMVVFDPNTGVVKFKSDLLFKSGSDKVLPGAIKAIGSLCTILNTEQAQQFDIIIAGHTDDQPIKYSRQTHPTNWHLSSHRAISVLALMEKNSTNPGRLSARGFAEYRSIADNKAGKKGNPKNRRVEIYIVPKGI